MSKRHSGPGKSGRKGISLMELNELFPDEAAATKWWEETQWGRHRCCGHCGSTNTAVVKSGKPMPYHCRDCRSYFSVRTGTSLQHSNLPLRKWAFAVYLYITNLKGISSMKLHRDLKVTQKTAWFMLHRLREAWDISGLPPMKGPVEVDETHVGGNPRAMHSRKRRRLQERKRGGPGNTHKTPVAGIKDRHTNTIRAKTVENVSGITMGDFINEHSSVLAKVYTDGGGQYRAIQREHETVRHNIGEYVREQATTNGIESFWALLKRGFEGTYHKMSPKHLDRYVREFARKHNIRESDTIRQMQAVVAGMTGRRLMYADLIADNGLESGARR